MGSSVCFPVPIIYEGGRGKIYSVFLRRELESERDEICDGGG